MQPIIRQKTAQPALPDFRNLGTILRILIAVNGVAAVGALLAVSEWTQWSSAWLDAVGLLEPHLLTTVMLLWLLQPALARLNGGAAVAVVIAVALSVVAVLHVLLQQVVSLTPAQLARHLLFALLVTTVLIGYFQLRAKALSPAITEARLQALQARIRPHFLFNSINAVLSLVRSEPKRAETALEDMADLFRVLMRDNRELGPIADEVELCRQYLALEKLRLGDRLQVEWHLNSMPGDALIPPLLLQPLLENAVYHGIEPSSAPGVVSVNIFYKGGDVHAIVRNPYRVSGGSHHAGNKMALGNVRERLALHFDAEASLSSHVKADAYEVHIAIPYRPAAQRDAMPADAGEHASSPVRSAANTIARFAARRSAHRSDSVMPRPEASRG
jgi:two-component system sensor histidine kinase AlgZ